ncbi:MAG: hypothetical protein Q8R39_02900 [bacterium]|nr:hypothetical protein [bacterium]MDZ4284503.1 hypothetical protein [Patescibacteria group bacterium]
MFEVPLANYSEEHRFDQGLLKLVKERTDAIFQAEEALTQKGAQEVRTVLENQSPEGMVSLRADMLSDLLELFLDEYRSRVSLILQLVVLDIKISWLANFQQHPDLHAICGVTRDHPTFPQAVIEGLLRLNS